MLPKSSIQIGSEFSFALPQWQAGRDGWRAAECRSLPVCSGLDHKAFENSG